MFKNFVKVALLSATAMSAQAQILPTPSFPDLEGKDYKSMLNFTIMDVCLDQNDKVIMGMTVLDPECKRIRNVRPTDTLLPYSAHQFPAIRETTRRGKTIKVGTTYGAQKNNVPIMRTDAKNNNLLFVLSPVDGGGERDCGARFNALPDTDKICLTPDKFRMRWTQNVFSWQNDRENFLNFVEGDTMNDPNLLGKMKPSDGYDVLAVSKDYTYIAGTMDAHGGGFWMGMKCSAADPLSPHRFDDSWIVGPAEIPPQGASGTLVARIHRMGSPLLPHSSEKCPPIYGRGFTTWSRQNVVYTGGNVLDSIIGSHYGGANPEGTGPGETQQIERFYLTRRLGFTRWEAWKRDDYTFDRNPEKTPKQASIDLLKSGQCNVAFPEAVKDEDGAYSTKVGDHKFYATACGDYTNLRPEPNGVPAILPGTPGLDEYFNFATK